MAIQELVTFYTKKAPNSFEFDAKVGEIVMIKNNAKK